MYEELVKRLRYRAKREDDYYEHGGDVINEAADAIEKLIEVIQNHDFLESLIKPRWVSVTERLPEEGEYVLVRYKNNDMAVACAFERDENFTFWRAQTDEGWCADCDTEPTHWMPLPPDPESPKEEV